MRIISKLGPIILHSTHFQRVLDYKELKGMLTNRRMLINVDELKKDTFTLTCMKLWMSWGDSPQA